MPACTLTFLGAVEECAILRRVTHFDDFSAGKQLHDQARRNDGRNAQLHQRTTIGGENDAHPVERIGRVGRHDAEQRNLVESMGDIENIKISDIATRTHTSAEPWSAATSTRTHLTADEKDEQGDRRP